MAKELKAAVVEKVADIVPPPRKEVVNTDYFVTLRYQPFTKVRADKTGSTCY